MIHDLEDGGEVVIRRGERKLSEPEDSVQLAATDRDGDTVDLQMTRVEAERLRDDLIKSLEAR
jgi:hypothetical protein